MSTPLLHLLHLVSPALPIGAYAYSQGLESAIDQQWVSGDDGIKQWISGVLMEGIAKLDAPVMLRCYDAIEKGDWEAFDDWNNWLLACRETRELLLEDQQMGVALQRLLTSLNVQTATRGTLKKPSFASQYALAACHWQVNKDDAVTGLCWSWLENQVAAATKIVPLGQTQAQKILVELLDLIPPACALATSIDDQDMGISLPGVAMASAQHEHQYSRLFRS